jgi:hypothetical protein
MSSDNSFIQDRYHESNLPPYFRENKSNNVIMCDDHITKLKEDSIKADRYCLQCKYPLCSYCVVEYHASHVSQAKIKLGDFLKEKRKEVEDMRKHVFSDDDNKKIVENIYNHIDDYNKNLDEELNNRSNKLEEIKEIIDKIITVERRSVEEIKEKIKAAYKDMYREKLKKYIDKSNENSLEIIALTDSWDTTVNNEKIEIIKNNTIVKLRDDSKLTRNILAMEVDGVKSSIITLLDFVKKFRNNCIQNTSAVSIELEIKSIYHSLKEKYDYVQKSDFVKSSKIITTGYDDFGINNKSNFEKAEENFKIYNSGIEFSKTYHKQHKEKFTVFMEKDNLIKTNSRNENNQNNPNIPGANQFNNKDTYNLLEEKDISQTSFAMQNPFSYEFVIAIKPNSKTITFFQQEFQYPLSIELEMNMYQDLSCIIEKFPNHCKFVNLGYSLLISGGITDEGNSIANCFLLMIAKKNINSVLKENYEISIMPYTCMLEIRERHCLVNLQDKKKVLACCGFNKNTVEIACLDSGQWKKLDSLRESRANATIAYTDNRFVWVFGGFKLQEGSKVGIYLNSAEVFDSNNENSKWNFIDFAMLTNPIKITAAGVINFNKGKILFCGGYDGNVYSKDIYCVEYNDGKIEKYEKTKLVLTNENIYFHSNFVKCGGYGVNFDYNMELNQYNPLTREFKIIK